MSCNAIFTTEEEVKLENTVMFRKKSNKLEDFSRDNLFISIYESCKFRQNPISDSEGLTGTIIGKLTISNKNGVIDSKELTDCVLTTLVNFDKTAANVYRGLYLKS